MKTAFVTMLAVSALGVLLFVVAVVPMLSTSTQEEEFDAIQEGPSPEEMPFFEDDFSNEKEYWFPRKVPATGTPHIRASELEGIPQEFYQVKLRDVPWIQQAIDNDRQLVRLDDNSLAEFFAFHDKQDVYSPYFQVSFEDGSVKYYDVRFHEVP